MRATHKSARRGPIRIGGSRDRKARGAVPDAHADPVAEAARLLGLGHYRDALHTASAALRSDPGNALLWNLSAGAALALGLEGDAEQFWKVAIAKSPEYAEAHYNLGVLYFGRENFDAASRCFARAVVLAPDHAKALNNLGAVLAEMQRYDEAVVLLERSIKLDAANPQAFHNLGTSLVKLDRIADAEASLARALQLKPDFAEAYVSCAKICIGRGDDAAAERLLDLALSADPRNGAAHLIRALQVKRVTEGAWLDRLRAAYRARTSRPVKDVIDLDFAMGKACEDLGDYDAAFEAYAEGNRLQFTRHPFDEPREQQTFEATIAAFDAEIYADGASAPAVGASESRVPIFVVGMPRSGTTLLEQILASHPQIHGGGELTLLGEILGPRPALPPSPEERAAWRASLGALGDTYLARAWTSETRSNYVVDKMPHNYRYLGYIPLMIPQARIIHVSRDPLDTCTSCFATRFAEGHEFSFDQAALGRHYVRYRRLMDHWRRVLPADRILEVRYESLVSETERVARQILSHLGLPWSERCTRFHENRRVVRTASRVQVRQPIYARSIARWRRFERHLGPLRAALAPVLEPA